MTPRGRGPAKTLRGAAALALLLVACPAASGTVNRCTGPGGEILFTDRECPPGHRRDRAFATEPERADLEPYFCRLAGTLGPNEVETAITEAERSLAAVGNGPDQSERAALWRACIASLRERKRVLETAETAAAAAPAPRKEAVATPCRSGTFRTENGLASFEVFFTNLGAIPCAGVDGYCLFHLFTGGPGDYRESGTVHFEGVVRPGETVRIGEVSSRGGPAGRSIAWSWCRLR